MSPSSWDAKNRTICQTTASGRRFDVALVSCQILSPARNNFAYNDSKIGSECGMDSINKSVGSWGRSCLKVPVTDMTTGSRVDGEIVEIVNPTASPPLKMEISTLFYGQIEPKKPIRMP